MRSVLLRSPLDGVAGSRKFDWHSRQPSLCFQVLLWNKYFVQTPLADDPQWQILCVHDHLRALDAPALLEFLSRQVHLFAAQCNAKSTAKRSCSVTPGPPMGT